MNYFTKQLTLLVVTIALSACGRVNQDLPSQTKAAVSFNDLQAAVWSINTIDYLPFEKNLDGCFARSLYMSMEIAARGIPVSNQFVIATSGSLSPAPGYAWNYHVAPAVWVSGFSEPSILDPSLFDYVVSRTTWVKKTKPTGQYELKFGPGSETVVRSPNLKQGPKFRSEMITEVEEVGSFRMRDISNSCHVMRQAIADEQLSEGQENDKIGRLIGRTKQLISLLDALEIGPHSLNSLDQQTPFTCD